MVWAEKVMGRSGHGPKWLWAEMTGQYMAGPRPQLISLYSLIIFVMPPTFLTDIAGFVLKLFCKLAGHARCFNQV